MYPLLIKIGSFSISTFGFFLGLSILFGVYLFLRSARRAGFNEEKSLDFVLLSLAVGLVIGRIISFVQYPAAGFWHSGYSFTGGIIGFGLVGYFYIRKLRWSFLKIGDCLVPAALTAFSFAQLGYFFGVSGKISDLLFCLLYFAAAFSSLIVSKKEPRTGAIFYWYSFIFFTSYFVYKVGSGQILKLGTLLMLALVIYFMVGLKRRGYLMEAPIAGELLQKLKERLLRYERRIDEQEKQIKSEDPSTQDGMGNRNPEFEDEANDENRRTFAQTTVASLENMKIQIKKALARMNIGKYGICERCGNPIDKARLEAFPEATLCLSCEKLREDNSPDED